MNNPICFALDVPTGRQAQDFVDVLEPYVGAFKVGLELFIASGTVPLSEMPIILDLKLHDIPETVSRAINAAGNIGVKYITLHVQQRATLEAALKAAEPFNITLLGVTVLTSMNEQDLMDLSMASDPNYFNPSARVSWLTAFGYSCGLRGFVCSPQEVRILKKVYPDAFFLVPGVRPNNASAGDQKRTGTPKQAVADGADLIVVGRPIRNAIDPVAAALEIYDEIKA